MFDSINRIDRLWSSIRFLMNVNDYLSIIASIFHRSIRIMKRMKSSTKLVGQMAQQSTEKVQSIKSSLPDPFSIATTISQPLVDMLSSNAVPSTSTGSEPVFVRSPQITSLNSEWFIGSAKRSAHSGRQQLVAKVISTDTAKILNTDLGLGTMV